MIIEISPCYYAGLASLVLVPYFFFPSTKLNGAGVASTFQIKNKLSLAGTGGIRRTTTMTDMRKHNLRFYGDICLTYVLHLHWAAAVRDDDDRRKCFFGCGSTTKWCRIVAEHRNHVASENFFANHFCVARGWCDSVVYRAQHRFWAEMNFVCLEIRWRWGKSWSDNNLISFDDWSRSISSICESINKIPFVEIKYVCDLCHCRHIPVRRFAFLAKLFSNYKVQIFIYEMMNRQRLHSISPANQPADLSCCLLVVQNLLLQMQPKPFTAAS